MTTSAVESQVRAHYPQALPAAAFRKRIIGWLEQDLGMTMAQVLLATSVCADDIVFMTDVAGNVETRPATQEMLGLFEMGGLAGLPVVAVKAQFRCEQIALVGVVIVNTSPGHEDYIDLRHSVVMRLADL